MTVYDEFGRRKEPGYPLQAEHHDVLVLKSPTGLYRARADKTNGALTSPLREVALADDGYRKAVRMATGSELRGGVRSQMGLSLLPVKPEPASAAFSCYLVNAPFFQRGIADAVEVSLKTRERGTWRVDEREFAQEESPGTGTVAVPDVCVAFRKQRDGRYLLDATHLDFVNTFTRAEWTGVDDARTYAVDDSDPKLTSLILNTAQLGLLVVSRLGHDGTQKKDVQDPPRELASALRAGAILGTVRDVAFVNLAALPASTDRLLVAMPDGAIRDLTLDAAGGTVSCRAFTSAQLKANPEVWRLLRNGCVLGRALVGAAPALVFNLCSLRGRRSVKDPAHPIQGTLDFKWTPGQHIRVAFQRPAAPAPWFEHAKRAVADLLAVWLTRADLTLDIAAEALPPLRDFLPRSAEHGEALRGVAYDILINLDPLPLTVPETARVDPERQISWPTSDLGSYALRRSYGVPTMFLGQPSAQGEAAAYFESAEFKHLALHEIGHALGLPHLFQAPELDQLPFLDDLEKIKRVLREALHVEVDDRFVTEELLRKWRDPAGNPFSEWPVAFRRVPGERSEALVERWAENSVMMGPPVQAIYRESGLLDQLRAFEAPRAVDESWIGELYPRKR